MNLEYTINLPYRAQLLSELATTALMLIDLMNLANDESVEVEVKKSDSYYSTTWDLRKETNVTSAAAV